nr:metallophosphoesterase [Kiritimatiellia bacterium]
MELTRKEFAKSSLAVLGFLALPGGLFAAPARWKTKKKPNLVVGILSDTHLQSGWDGVTPHGGFPLTYVTNAMKLFRERNIDAFMHLGDMAHRGKNIEAQYHRDIFEKFFPNGKGKDGRKVEKLLVAGNHEWYGDAVGGPGAWAPSIWPDKAERDKHTLIGNMPKHWKEIWGETYEPVWHKEVKGYHFFGRHWDEQGTEAALADFILAKAEECSLKGSKPFFILSHERN